VCFSKMEKARFGKRQFAAFSAALVQKIWDLG
jgi:hypothetical protein